MSSPGDHSKVMYDLFDRLYVCMYACMHACMYVCMNVCMYEAIYESNQDKNALSYEELRTLGILPRADEVNNLGCYSTKHKTKI
jgi:hypothetical protein